MRGGDDARSRSTAAARLAGCTLTISASDTGWAWIVMAGAVAMFWVARTQFRRGGVRRTVRMVSAIGLCRVAPGDRAGGNGRKGHLLAVQDRVRGPAALRSVRQPQSFRHLGHHGAAAVPRLHCRSRRPARQTSPEFASAQKPARACDRSAHGLADGGGRDDARRAAAVAVAIGRARAGRLRSRDGRPLPTSTRSPAPAAECWRWRRSWWCAASPGPTSRHFASAWPARRPASRTA